MQQMDWVSQVAAVLREKTAAKCGGKKLMIQGSVQASEQKLRAVLADIAG